MERGHDEITAAGIVARRHLLEFLFLHRSEERFSNEHLGAGRLRARDCPPYPTGTAWPWSLHHPTDDRESYRTGRNALETLTRLRGHEHGFP
jgi:hypothetical protein